MYYLNRKKFNKHSFLMKKKSNYIFSNVHYCLEYFLAGRQKKKIQLNNGAFSIFIYIFYFFFVQTWEQCMLYELVGSKKEGEITVEIYFFNFIWSFFLNVFRVTNIAKIYSNKRFIFGRVPVANQYYFALSL